MTIYWWEDQVGGGANRFAPTAKPKNAKGTLMRIIQIYMRLG